MAIRHTKLPFEAKTYIVSALACCEKPSYILAEVEEIWGIKLFPKSLNHYHPERNPRLDYDLILLFNDVRRRFWQERAEAIMNCLNYRQKQRERLFFRNARNPHLQRKILNDAAKDVGGLFSNVRMIDLKNEMQPGMRPIFISEAVKKRMKDELLETVAAHGGMPHEREKR